MQTIGITLLVMGAVSAIGGFIFAFATAEGYKSLDILVGKRKADPNYNIKMLIATLVLLLGTLLLLAGGITSAVALVQNLHY